MKKVESAQRRQSTLCDLFVAIPKLVRQNYLPPPRHPDFGRSREGYGRYDNTKPGSENTKKYRTNTKWIFLVHLRIFGPQPGVGDLAFFLIFLFFRIQTFLWSVPGLQVVTLVLQRQKGPENQPKNPVGNPVGKVPHRVLQGAAQRVRDFTSCVRFSGPLFLCSNWGGGNSGGGKHTVKPLPRNVCGAPQPTIYFPPPFLLCDSRKEAPTRPIPVSEASKSGFGESTLCSTFCSPSTPPKSRDSGSEQGVFWKGVFSEKSFF